MVEIEDLKKRVADLERRLDIITRELCPTPTDIEAEVDDLVQRLGSDGAAKEINRRYRLKRAV